jgi:hypothetical protein
MVAITRLWMLWKDSGYYEIIWLLSKVSGSYGKSLIEMEVTGFYGLLGFAINGCYGKSMLSEMTKAK